MTEDVEMVCRFYHNGMCYIGRKIHFNSREFGYYSCGHILQGRCPHNKSMEDGKCPVCKRNECICDKKAFIPIKKSKLNELHDWQNWLELMYDLKLAIEWNQLSKSEIDSMIKRFYTLLKDYLKYFTNSDSKSDSNTHYENLWHKLKDYIFNTTCNPETNENFKAGLSLVNVKMSYFYDKEMGNILSQRITKTRN